MQASPKNALKESAPRAAGPLRCISDRGFTLIEVVVVLAIIAILALISVPSYIDKIVRDQVNESLPLVDFAKSPVQDKWRDTKEFPADNKAADLPAADKIVSNLVSSVVLEKGALHMTFGNRVNGAISGKMLTLRPAVVEDDSRVPITWICGYASAPPKMKAIGKNKTDIAPLYLPSKCRSLLP